MHARVIRTQTSLDKIDEATSVFRTDVIGAADEQPELSSVVLLADRATGKAISITLWQSEQAMRAAQESGWTQQQVARFAGMFVAEPAIETYEVGVRQPPTETMSHARVVSVQIKPDKLDDAVALYRDSVLPAAGEQQGFLGGLLLTDRSSGKGLSITGWASEADLQAGDASGYFQDQLRKFGEMFSAPPSVEVLEVAAARIRP
jgi:heme-degrading monooxygenase HmoA